MSLEDCRCENGEREELPARFPGVVAVMLERRTTPAYWRDAVTKILENVDVTPTSEAGRIAEGILLLAVDRAGMSECVVSGTLEELIAAAIRRQEIEISDAKQARKNLDPVISKLRRSAGAEVMAFGGTRKIALDIKSRGPGGPRPGLYTFRLYFSQAPIGDPSAYWSDEVRTALYRTIEDVGFVGVIVDLDALGELGAIIADDLIGAHSPSTKNLQPFAGGIAHALAEFLADRLRSIDGPESLALLRSMFRLTFNARAINMLDFYPSFLRSIEIASSAADANRWQRLASVIVPLPTMSIPEKLYAFRLLGLISAKNTSKAAAEFLRMLEGLADPQTQSFDEHYIPDESFGSADFILQVRDDHKHAVAAFRRKLKGIRANPRLPSA